MLVIFSDIWVSVGKSGTLTTNVYLDFVAICVSGGGSCWICVWCSTELVWSLLHSVKSVWKYTIIYILVATGY